MARKEKTIHYLYKTTCVLTNRYYIGIHSTNNLEDGYMGSGKRLRYSIRKHGIENHIKEILEFFESREKLIEGEINLITPDMVTDKNCMNLKLGGNGGFICEEQQKYRSICGNKKLNEKLRFDKEFKENWLNNMKNGVQKAMNGGKMKTWKDNYDWLGKEHSDETKKKMSENRKGINNQSGMCWVSNEYEKKKIRIEYLEDYLKNGWVRGKLYNINEIISYYKIAKSYNKTAKYFAIPKSTIVENIKNYSKI